ncbi:helix-turn-helix domain-containing protein [Nocardia cyriacigeorgica]|uniref:helix-turn-helix domain-containing protein n=1 Tax=Nocardia cyriacigeorgica TaxID=135487 RepID=UPI0024586864|nr:helix-turn-helix transcriptional regulator [Nocardia cyriacigeorgica]
MAIDDAFNKEVGRRVRAARCSARCSVTDAARALGLTDAQYEALERGTRPMDAAEVIVFCSAMGIRAHALLDGLEQSRPGAPAGNGAPDPKFG